jgi:O-antigen/teichoic acid export membrane protein
VIGSRHEGVGETSAPGEVPNVRTGTRRQGPADAPPPTRALSKRASLNSIAALLEFGARSVVEFFINPLLVVRLGSYLFGAWRVLVQMSGYLWATSGRSSPALTVAIANRAHSSDYDDKRRLVGCAVLTWFIFLPLLAAIGALGVWFAPALLKTTPSDVGAIRLTAGLLVADAIVLTGVMLPWAVVQGENLGYKRMGLTAFLVLLNGVFMGVAVYLGTGIVGVAVANVVDTLLTGVVFWYVARRYVHWFGLARPTREMVRWFLGLNWWFTAWKFVSELMSAGDIVILGLFGPVQLVAVYALTKYVPDGLSALLTNPLQGVTPGMGGIIGSGDFRRAVRARNDFMGFTWLVVTAAGATILVWNRSFVTLWVGHRYYAGTVATLLIVLLSVQFVLIRNDAYIIDATLKIRTKVLVGLLSTVISLGFAIVLIRTLDSPIVGVSIGFLAGRSILSLTYPMLVGRVIGHPLPSQLRGALRPSLVALGAFGGGALLGPHLFTHRWVVLVPAVGATAVSLVPLVAVAGLPTDMRARLLRRTMALGRAAVARVTSW